MKKLFVLSLVLSVCAFSTGDSFATADVVLSSQKYVDDTFEDARGADNITRGYMSTSVLPIGDNADEIVGGADSRFYSFSLNVPKMNGLTQEEYKAKHKEKTGSESGWEAAWQADYAKFLKNKLGSERVLVWVE